jgi:asparagine synthase (glutamine-hydrolysing)
MCGISGFVDPENLLVESQSVLKKMTDLIIHRGPDDKGHWLSPDNIVGIGHRRLSIHDLSASGHQPMISQCQRYIMAFNGEIYNFQNLKEQLIVKGYQFEGQSDTEVLLNLIVEMGIEEAVKQAEGMFAIALYDIKENKISFARDRMGEKPLYVGMIDSMVIFGSELKIFKAVKNWQSEISSQALSCYFDYGYIPGPLTIYENVVKISPGSILTLDAKNIRPITEWQEKKYWSLENFIDTNKLNYQSLSEVTEKLDTLLKSTIEDQLVADVPLGMFLSGGIDSSAVVAVAQAVSVNKVKTFSIGFEEDSFNEAPFAEEVAKALGTDHTELYCSAEMVKASIKNVIKHYDEPFSDASQLPTLALCKLAREHVTVCLSGDGGDELFFGYSRYFRAKNRSRQVNAIPKPLRSLISFISSQINPRMISYDTFQKIGLICERISLIGSKWNFYRTFISRGGLSNQLVRNKSKVDFLFTRPKNILSFDDAMRFSDTKQYLTDDILVKVDRASMASSLEVRVPLLNHNIVEFAWTLSNEILNNGVMGKLPLREILKKYLPDIDFDRPKKGFGVPLGHWLQNDLKDWAFKLLFNNDELIERYLNIDVIKKIWYQHQKDKRDYSGELWDIIIFILWLKNDQSYT